MSSATLKRFSVGGLGRKLGRDPAGRSTRQMSQMGEAGALVAPRGALSVVKPKGGHWLSGSVEYALRGLKPARFPAEGGGFEIGSPAEESIRGWIEGPLTKYVKARMASPDDEVRRLAEEGVLHVDPATLPNRAGLVHPSGNDYNLISETTPGRQWEHAADYQVRPEMAGNIPTASKLYADNPWLGDVKVRDPRTPIYQFADVGRDTLGFPHLIDELSNALNPASGLPRHLQLTPEAMKQLSMEKAVRHVADINAWRAAQKVEANRRLTEQASIVREYAENNPKGLRWVELKAPEPPEGWVQEGEAWRHPDAWRKEVAKEHPWLYPKDKLAEQLKYEGEAMQNCVSGYCDDVLSGRTRIFSLRDAKGEPHVTVEVGKAAPRNVSDDMIVEYIEAGEPANMRQWAIDNGYALEARRLNRAAVERVKASLAAGAQEQMSIVQIKGKQNRAPKDEYLPFVQDFVRNSPLGGQWSEVGDLGNTGLRKLNYEMFGSLGPSGEAAVNQLREQGRHFLTDKELQTAYDAVYNTGRLPEGFSHGGRATLP